VRTFIACLAAILIGFFALSAVAATTADAPPRIAKEKFRPLLGNPDVVIIDVRQPSDWNRSKLKIKGAVREDTHAPIAAWMSKYPKEKTLVFY